MKKLSLLILLVVGCARIGFAQQADVASSDTLADSVAEPRPAGSNLFMDFTAIPGGSNRVLLDWDTDSAVEGDYFIIERSPDERHYETIGVVRVAVGTQHYEVTDAAAPNGSDFYLIKYTARTGAPVYFRKQCS